MVFRHRELNVFYSSAYPHTISLLTAMNLGYRVASITTSSVNAISPIHRVRLCHARGEHLKFEAGENSFTRV